MPRLIDIELMAHPLNWATVILMCAFAAVLFALVFPEAAAPPAEASQTVLT